MVDQDARRRENDDRRNLLEASLKLIVSHTSLTVTRRETSEIFYPR